VANGDSIVYLHDDVFDEQADHFLPINDAQGLS
jgi:hypothetical protein